LGKKKAFLGPWVQKKLLLPLEKKKGHGLKASPS
jgi:hypothetical protein